jgi:PmbA protein
MFDQLSALDFDSESTGNATRAEGYSGGKNYRALPKTKALNFSIEGNSQPYEKMIEEIDNALVVHQLLGAHTANSASGDFSVNSPTLFKIINGDLTCAGKQVMITGNVPKLMKQIKQIGDDYKSIGGGLTPVAQWLPSIVIEGLKII